MDDIDYLFYIHYYEDLIKNKINTKEKAINHWNMFGKNENRVNCFDWLYYINLYDDLKNNNINTKEKAFNHWLHHGKNENRECVFNWMFYINYHDDMIINGIDNKEKAITHWLNHGKNENRETIFNYEFYNKFNNLNLSKNDAFIHWLTIGKFNNMYCTIEQVEKNVKTDIQINFLTDYHIINELLIKHDICDMNIDIYDNVNSYDINKNININKSIENFNWMFYLCYYPELVDMGIDNVLKATVHWLEYGRNKNMICNYDANEYMDFDWEFYTYYYEDLKHIGVDTELKALVHWIKYGKHENRICSLPYDSFDDFDWEFYITYYDDLVRNNINTKTKALIHWIKSGEREGRIGSYDINQYKDFNWEFYIYYYNDLIRNNINTKMKAIIHYMRFGKKEGRICNYDPNLYVLFDWTFYTYYYNDVLLSGNDTYIKALVHYIKYGKNEGRICNELYITLDWKNYKLSYPEIKYELRKDIINYFINTGYYLNHTYNIIPNTLFTKLYIDNITNHISSVNFINKYKIYNNNVISDNNINYTKTRKSPNYIKKDFIDINIIDKFILIVDFPNLGGGTTIFLNYIISYYKQFITFIIIRNHNTFIELSVNDDYEIKNSFDNDSYYMFIEQNINKIHKIFVNHTMGHTIDFINYLFTLNKDITTLTHDMSLIYDKPQLDYFEVKEYNKITAFHNIIDINNYSNIIFQNEANINIYYDFIKNKDKIIISSLPDYNNTLDKYIITHRHIITICFVGAISHMKGRDILKTIIDYYMYNNMIKIIVFGYVEIPYFDNYFQYNNIDEFNELLKFHKPNIMIDTSIWHETYSYTLSLMMLTRLPILYLNKYDISTIENRLKNYPNAYPYNNMEELNNLIIMKAQYYFYTIDNKIYFNDYWDNYFKPSIKPYDLVKPNNYNNMNIVLITSKIYINNNVPYTYSKKRSIYTKDERYQQTLITIESIRRYIPNSYIVMIDNSIFTEYEYNNLTKLTDYFINITDNMELNYYTDNCKYKYLGELYQQLMAFNIFFKNINYNNIKYLFKISGRYKINNKFNYMNFDNNMNIFKQNNNVHDRTYYYTSFYKLNNDFIDIYFKLLNNAKINKYKHINKDFEVIFAELFKNYIHLIDNLGITQLIGPMLEISDI